MIIDAHYHLDERMEPIDEVLSQMEENSIDRIALMAVPCDPFHVTGAAEKLSAVARIMLAGRLNRVGLIAYRNTVDADGMFSVLGDKYNIYQEPDNSKVAEVIEKHPDRFYGWIFVNPSVSDPVEEIEKRAQDSSWIGVKTHPFWHRYSVRMLDDTAALCVEKGMPLLLHLGADRDNGDFRFLPERHPGLNVIYAHGGLPFFREMWGYCKKRDKVFLDLSSPYLNVPLRKKVVRVVGPEKCIHGTDGPYGYPSQTGFYDHGAILSEVLNLSISDREKELILSKNFLDIARIP